MEEDKTEEPKKPWESSPKYEVEKARQKDEIYKSTLGYLNGSKKVQKYLQRFNHINVRFHIENYAWRKAEWLVSKDYHDHWHDHMLLETKNEAEECLMNIQQKRLFDKQCEWRAGMFTHPAIETTHDFRYWEHNVLNCPFIDPITSEDVDLYIEFLNTYFGENLAFLGSWQDYDTYCTNKVTVTSQVNKSEMEEEDDEDGEDYDDGEEDDDEVGRLMPPWYLFWEERRGASNYGILPDKRKEKEEVYFRLGFNEGEEIAREKLKVNPPDKRPFFNLYDEKKLFDFIDRCEKPGEKNRVIKAYETNRKVYFDKEEDEAMYWVKEAWFDLKDCLEPFPIAPGITDWKEALIQTAKNWNHLKLIRMLPVVYDEYLFRLETGIAQPCDQERAEWYRKDAAKNKGHILRGRELKGEPKDLNF